MFMYKASPLGLHLQLFEDSFIYWGSGWHRRSFCSQMPQVYINLRGGFGEFHSCSRLMWASGARSDLKGILQTPRRHVRCAQTIFSNSWSATSLRSKYSQMNSESGLQTLTTRWDEAGKGDRWRVTRAQPAESLTLWALTSFSTLRFTAGYQSGL